MRLPPMPDALQWSHNARYHAWVEAQVPSHGAVLDVGCGRGTLARRLAARGAQVDAVDVSPAMLGSSDDVRWLRGDVMDERLPVREAYDAVVCVAALHHLPLEAGMARLASLVRPGGVLAVVGLARPASASDHALGALATPANLLVGVGRAARGRAGKPDERGMPVREPVETLHQVRAAAALHLPGAGIRRALFWRYLLRWDRRAG